ncbi:hypothetical protein [Roseicyclus persicicus]|uniref:Metal-binding protein n=1 Tax=Roseicyclus persicicus TaxID=2650661 RepID=A0A7X6GXS5_9RHOB|nr:hypothetical protein [Roseibacterium persicicum]NKX44364.1 hypothetical protein [Roseibacterium persicicum]
MTLQNRVLPTGEIVADAAYRGTLMGNRGILHDEHQRLGTARWKLRGWVCCALSFKGRKRVPMSPGRYTELFFLDEAVALAAGHRPCAECRRADYERFRAAWAGATGALPRAPEMDAALHPARVTRTRAQVRHEAEAAALPDGAFVLWQGAAHLVTGDAIRPFGVTGYGAPRPRPMGAATVLTPRPSLAVLAAGYRPALHPTATA